MDVEVQQILDEIILIYGLKEKIIKKFMDGLLKIKK